MTLIVALMAPAQAILVSDRRLTHNGQLVDDEKNKATVLFCADGRMALAITGLAQVGRFETSRAVLRLLAQAAQPDHLLLPTIQRFAIAMSDEIKKVNVPAKQKHLQVVFAGYRYNYEQSTATPVLGQVTNVADRSGALQESATKEFLLWTPRNPYGIFGFGMTAGVAPADRTKLKELLRQGKPASALVEKTVDTIRNAADSPRSKNMVGKQCMSIVVPLRGAVIANYHSAAAKNTMYLPSYVVSTPTASLTNEGASVEQQHTSAAPLVIPKVGRNHPCPCGSGMKYKRCHGRTRS